MKRREFMAVAGLSALALGTGAAPGVARGADAPRGGGTVGPPLGPEEELILSLASLAPNGHNTQPWSVKAAAKDRWIVGVDPARRLPAVDPTDRETVISLGTFLENLVQGARALGREATVEVLSDRRDAPALYEVRLAPRPAEDGGAVTRIEARRTQRRGFRSDPIAAADRDALLAAA
jgi:nitroreductase